VYYRHSGIRTFPRLRCKKNKKKLTIICWTIGNTDSTYLSTCLLEAPWRTCHRQKKSDRTNFEQTGRAAWPQARPALPGPARPGSARPELSQYKMLRCVIYRTGASKTRFLRFYSIRCGLSIIEKNTNSPAPLLFV